MTKVLHGSVSILEELAKEWDVKSVVLVRGVDSRVTLDVPCDARVHATPNPTTRDIERSAGMVCGASPDLVIGVGGGSAMDSAKLIASELDLPCFVAPTTAGTGAEVTPFATVYRDGVKESMGCRAPFYAVLDPELTMSMPREVAASSGLDALCQGIESLWSIKSTAESRAYSRECIRLCAEHLYCSVKHPDVENRRAMLRAANLSGRAIAIAGTTAAHAMSYHLTAEQGIPHGIAVAHWLTAVHWWNEDVTSEDCVDPRGPEWVKGICEEIHDLLPETVSRVVRLQLECPMPSSPLRDLPWSRADPARLANNPRRAP